MSHDYALQRQGTLESLALMRAEAGADLPEAARVIYLFEAEELKPNWAGAERALKALGFTVRRLAEEGLLEAEVGPLHLTPEEVWHWEEAATRAVLKFDFWPDGWELAEDPA